MSGGQFMPGMSFRYIGLSLGLVAWRYAPSKSIAIAIMPRIHPMIRMMNIVGNWTTGA